MGNRDVSVVFKASDRLSDSLHQMRKGVRGLESDVEHQMLRMDANRFNQAVLSMLIYPVPNDTDREVKMQLSKDEENQLLIFRITIVI